MKAKNVALISCVVLLSIATSLCAESESSDARPSAGVLLDATPLPDLLVKHLRLSLKQGIRIKNVYIGSPADKAGLERDDIIIGFQGEDVDDYERFVNEVRKAGVGTEVSLEIIHLGKRKTVKLELNSREGYFALKYLPEPGIVQSWRPGKIFRLKPGDKNWTEILRDGMPPEFDVNIKRFFNKLYTYHHSDGEDYTIMIEGNPDDDDSTITVQACDNEYKTTLGEINKLPEKYREPAEQAVKNARKAAKTKRWFEIREKRPWPMLDDWNSKLRQDLPPNYFQIQPFEPGGQMFDRIQKQMEELQRRLDRLEKRQ